MPLPTGARRLLGPFRAQASAAVLLFDFDGTLSPLVSEPDAAVAAPGVADALVALARSYATVGAVSGRPVAFLADRLPPGLTLSGLYGLESLVAGRVEDHPEAPPWRTVVDGVVAQALAAAEPGVLVEHKGLSVTLHWRQAPEAEAATVDLAAALAAESGLEARPAKASVELHPPIHSDKGTVVRALAEAAGATAVLYAGDDLGDLPAFVALRELAAEGVTTLAVAVGGPELPEEVRSAADVVLDDPIGVVELLHALDPRTPDPEEPA